MSLVNATLDAIGDFLPTPGSSMLLLRTDSLAGNAKRFRWRDVLATLTLLPRQPASNHALVIPFAGGTAFTAGRIVRFVMTDPQDKGHVSGTVTYGGEGGDLVLYWRRPFMDFEPGVLVAEGTALPAGALVIRAGNA